MPIAPFVTFAASLAGAALDEAAEQCPHFAPLVEIGPESVVRRIGSLPSFDWFDPREMRRRGPHGEAIVPLIGLYDLVEWTDGVPLSVEDPFARVRDPPPPPWDPRGVALERVEGPGRPSRARLVFSGKPGVWHDDITGWRYSDAGPAPRIAYSARDGRAASVVLDGVTLDRAAGPDARSRYPDFGFSRDGALLYWSFDDRTTRVRDARGAVSTYACEPARNSALIVGERGILLDCRYSEFALVVVMNDGRVFPKPLPGGDWLEAWWISADGAHFVTSTDRWVVIDGVRGPEATAIWALEIDEPRREVRYLALFQSGEPSGRVVDVVEVITRWPPDGTCGEPFVEWQHG